MIFKVDWVSNDKYSIIDCFSFEKLRWMDKIVSRFVYEWCIEIKWQTIGWWNEFVFEEINTLKKYINSKMKEPTINAINKYTWVNTINLLFINNIISICLWNVLFIIVIQFILATFKNCIYE